MNFSLIKEKISPKFLFIISALFIGFFCFCATSIIPPLQSPDEVQHLRRAYFLSQGHILLTAPPHEASGGDIDSGLDDYLAHFFTFAAHQERKITEGDSRFELTTPWSNQQHFAVAQGTGYYFPLIYTPQAIGLLAGHASHLSIDRSYRLARVLATLTATAVTVAAFAIYSPNVLVLALVVLPMSLFQSASASLDGLATAFTLLALSTFCQIVRLQTRAPLYLFYLLSIAVTLVATSRLHAFPLLLLPFAAWYYTRQKTLLWQAVFCSVFTIGWTLLAMKINVFSLTPNASASGKFKDIIVHPFHFLHLVGSTLLNQDKQEFYITSFIGNLGWLDTPLPARFYHAMLVLLCVITILSIKWDKPLAMLKASGLLLFAGCASFLLIFIALYAAWTAPDSPVIEGIQGRYFLVPALFLAYSLGKFEITGKNLCAFSVFVLTFLFSVHSVIPILLTRYYIGS
ncbi:hypothetical protein ACI01nite_01960 [Acetobacter cibinongensis]|uniref:DUF2142 domain-containing protein n=1 Tax=Acetobacter cibinongensis TaxID=146475 RepID=A0A0D6N207_9PROT|nr:DUF2142 domain-containing protein [Acetobacter cibinongensis]GAN59974.1 hypothetical protein Abci_008_107 [Acetobacter cibinongensis]GEL57594.1 hypothetical protein ACI01nite_01960 [Acetobacter cibinongensis]